MRPVDKPSPCRRYRATIGPCQSTRSARATRHSSPSWSLISPPAKRKILRKFRTRVRCLHWGGRAAYWAVARARIGSLESAALRSLAKPLPFVGASAVPNLTAEEKKAKAKELANAIAKERDCDVMILNYGFDSGFEILRFLPFIRARKNKHPNVLVFVTSEGGDADCAYRIGRFIQDAYQSITVVVSGWCKSAGTLVCIAANELIVCDAGELGPLDVQLSKLDEVGERSSGLAIEASFEKLQKESSKLFMRYLQTILSEIPGRISFRTAADIASHMATGATAPIFSKIDPLAVGEDYRANLVAEQYAVRLNLKSRNLREGDNSGLRMLASGYPSHRFVIDRAKASRLFQRVSRPAGNIAELVSCLGRDVIVPRSSARSEEPRLEFINDESQPPVAAIAGAAPAATKGRPRATAKAGTRARNIRRNLSARAQQTRLGRKAGGNSARPNGSDI